MYGLVAQKDGGVLEDRMGRPPGGKGRAVGQGFGVPRGRLLARMFVPGKSGPRFGQVVWPLAFAIHNRTEVRLCQTRNHPLTTGGT